MITYLAYFVMDFSTCFSFPDCRFLLGSGPGKRVESEKPDINTQSHIYAFGMINSSAFVHPHERSYVNAKKCFFTRRFESLEPQTMPMLGRGGGKEIEIVYRFGISHDFCYFLKCSNLFNYHNILCSQPPATLAAAFRNLFLCFA